MKEKNYIFDITNIRDLAPNILKSNEMFGPVLQVIDLLITKHIIANRKFLFFLERIDRMSELELDILAKELSVDFYDSSFSIEQKRELCKQSFPIHSIKGTNKAVQNLMKIFYEDSRIVEFPEFNGKAGTFKLEITGNSKNNIDTLLRQVETVKKKSQHLKGLIFKSNINDSLHINTDMRIATKHKILPRKMYFYLNNLNLKAKDGRSTFIIKGGKNG